jgi:hypothetical protein
MNLAMVVLAVVISGSVVVEKDPIPGCTVRLVSPERTFTTISSFDGEFSLSDVTPGTYDLTVALSGFETVRRVVDVGADEVLAPIEMKMAAITEPVLACGGIPLCTHDAPGTKWEVPRCADYELHMSLIEAAGRNDRSAIAMLRRRYDLETSIRERFRIAGALLGKLDDRELWSDLYEAASLAVRYAPVDGKYPPESVGGTDLRIAGSTALRYVAGDPRARALLHDALKTSDRQILDIALDGLAAQRDHSSLPAIRAMLAREKDRASWLALRLARFDTAEADALAFEYLLEDARGLYLEHRTPTALR